VSWSALDELASAGIAARTPQEVADLAAALETASTAQDNRRDRQLAATLHRVEAWRRQHDGAGGVPRQVLTEVDDAIRTAASALLARGHSNVDFSELLERIELLLSGPDDWRKRGFANPSS
jgi:hypothetical protein